MNKELLKRIKSFAWRLGAFLVVAGLGYLSDHLIDLQLPISVQTVLALVLGELTKWLNSR